MISVDEARTRILAGLGPTPPEIVPLSDAWGRISGAPHRARLTQPPHDISAMDGYAVRSDEAGLDAKLVVVGSAPAGHPWDGRLAAGQTLRIFTGSVMPDGSDGVLIQEDADRVGNAILVREAVRPGRHIRRAGQDFTVGDELVAAGKRLNSRDIGLLAAGNHPWVTVHRRPRIAILATGDEIVMPGEVVPPGGIVSSNSHALAALIRTLGAEPVVLPVAPDEAAALAALTDAARGCDMLLTTGGASVGDHDLVAASPGLALDFWKIAMRPGKPVMHGRFRDVPMIGLPGNPVSSLVCGIIFVMPAILKMSGLPGHAPTVSQAVLGSALPANDQRADHLRATLELRDDGLPVARAFERQDSGMLHALARADALILREPHAPAIEAGARVAVIRMDLLGI